MLDMESFPYQHFYKYFLARKIRLIQLNIDPAFQVEDKLPVLG